MSFLCDESIFIPVLPPGPAAFVTKLTTLLFLMLPLVKYISIHRRYLAPGFRSAINVPVVESRFATLNTLHEGMEIDYLSVLLEMT